MSRLGVALALVFGSLPFIGEPSLGDETTSLEEKLLRLAEVRYLDTPLADVVSDLELRYKLKIELDAESLAAKNIGSDFPLTKILKGVRLQTIFELLFGGRGMTWTVHDDFVLITTTEGETNYLQTKVYNVGDVGENPEAVGNLIAASLAPETWRNKEGKVGSIAPLANGKLLVITHTWRMHREIAWLLEDLRESNKQAIKQANKEPSGIIEKELEKPTEVQYLDTPLADAFTDLELRHKIIIAVDDEALAAEGLDANLSVSRTLFRVPLASALDLILPPQLTWTVYKGALLITTRAKESKYLETKIYPVGKLHEQPEAIGNMIVQSLEPESWRSNKGKLGSMAPHEKSKSLVILHTSRMHRRIAKLLGDIREVDDEAKKARLAPPPEARLSSLSR